jgi:hypothetical protein
MFLEDSYVSLRKTNRDASYILEDRIMYYVIIHVRLDEDTQQPSNHHSETTLPSIPKMPSPCGDARQP